MHILVTGGCGFIGSHFINSFSKELSEKLKIVNIDALYYCADLANIEKSVFENPYYTFVKGNIRSTDLVSHVLATHNITHVVHFAAQSHVQNSFSDSILFTQDNVLGTHTLLECCRKYGNIQRFVHVSTDEVYGESGNELKTEQSVLCPTNPYAATKASAELITRSYMHSFGLPVLVTRGNNVYGTGQYPEKLIPKFIKFCMEGKKMTIQGNGGALRSFLHVKDTISAFRAILHKGKIGETYNIGCDEGMEYSVIQVAEMITKEILGEGENVEDHIVHIEDRPFNDQRYHISNSKLRSLGWEVTVKFEEGLRELIASEAGKR